MNLSLQAQTNVRAWYADGQVWVIWNIQLPLSETVGVYASENEFSNTEDATLIGRPFLLEILPSALKEQVDTSLTYRIPDGQGGIYQLSPNEGLFVYTPHEESTMYFAVVRWGDNTILAGQNITDVSIPFSYDPVNDPVESHLQATFTSPFNLTYRSQAFYMWVDGRDDEKDARPDFPVMGNSAKNGMPGFFLISAKNNIDTTNLLPLNVWLHGGGGSARQSLAGSRRDVDIDPQEGILLSHNDDVFGWRGPTIPFIENPSLHFGYRRNWDPFSSDNLPSEPDTIVNYTQRRYLWIDDWMIRRFKVDPKRIHIHGHSMGSWGATGLVKAYPEHYASAVIFNNGFRGHEEGANIAAMFGEPSARFPTNLRNRFGEFVHYPDIFDLITNASAQRDLPVFHSYHSKNDVGNANYWGPEVVQQYTLADAQGHGMKLSWSERAHGMDTGPDFDDHWINGNEPDMQTILDNVDWAESQFRSDISYPAFYFHNLDPNANNPGDGTPGTGQQGVGDDWGTWGGWHRWDTKNITDEETIWSVEAWLESNAVFENDNSPHEKLTSHLAIRRPVNFKPLSGNTIYWEVKDATTGDLLQIGSTPVFAFDLVTISGIEIYQEDIRRVKITVSSLPVSAKDLNDDISPVMIYPNPVSEDLFITTSEIPVGIMLYSQEGSLIKELYNTNRIHFTSLNSGIYFLQIIFDDNVHVEKVVKN